MSRLARTLGEIYPPGLRILVYLEDFGVWYEDACGYGLPMRSSVRADVLLPETIPGGSYLSLRE
jgi:hypothetical protein